MIQQRPLVGADPAGISRFIIVGIDLFQQRFAFAEDRQFFFVVNLCGVLREDLQVVFADHVAPGGMSGDIGQRLAAKTETAVLVLEVDEVAGVFQKRDKIPVQLGNVSFGLLAPGDVGDNAVPEYRSVHLPLRYGIAQQPEFRFVGELQPVFVVPRGQVFGRFGNGSQMLRQIIRVHHGKYRRGILANIVRTDAVDLTEDITGVGNAGTAIGAQAELEHHSGQPAGNLVEAAQRLIP